MVKFILASASPRRKELLAQVGIDFEVIKSNVEEIITKTEPSEVVMELSMQKALDVYNSIENDNDTVVVIGADTIVYCNGRILGKPKDTQDAFDMIKSISGGKHSVFTGVTLVIDGKARSFYEETVVNVYPMTDEEINKYIDTKEPFDKAGAYGIQGKFAAFVSGISGDYNNVVGLPVGRICNELRKEHLI